MKYNPEPREFDEPVRETREMSNMPIDILIDSSMFADSGIESTITMIRELPDDLITFHIPMSFYDILDYAVEHEGQLQFLGDHEVIDYFSLYSGVSSVYDTAQVVMESDLRRFDPTIFYEDEMRGLYQRLYENLPAPDVYDDYESPYAPRGFRLADIYLEELLFGLLMSPVLSRLKKTARDLKNGVDYLVELSDDLLEKVTEEIRNKVSNAQTYRDILYDELKELEEQSRERHGNEQEAPVRKIAILREIVKTYPDTNYINYVVKSVPPGLGAAGGYSIGGPMGAAAGGVAGRFIGLYFADP